MGESSGMKDMSISFSMTINADSQNPRINVKYSHFPSTMWSVLWDDCHNVFSKIQNGFYVYINEKWKSGIIFFKIKCTKTIIEI